MIVLFDDQDNEVCRRHEPVHREVEPGQVFTIHVTFQAEQSQDEE